MSRFVSCLTILFVALLCSLAPLAAPAPAPVVAGEAFEPRVFRVFDGDRFLARARGRTFRVRIRGIDAPELGQPHGPESQAILVKMIGSRRVRVEPSGVLDGDYQVSGVYWQDYDISAELVRVGAAWAVPGDGVIAPELAELERIARRERRGLWSGEDPQAPWEWRLRRGSP